MARNSHVTADDKERIINLSKTMDIPEICNIVKKSEAQVRRVISQHSLMINAKRKIETLSEKEQEIARDIKKTKTWQQLTEELSPSELLYYEEKYAQYMAQFKDDVLVTEQTQISLLIKFEIMMHRNAKAKYTASQDIARLVTMQNDFLAGFPDRSAMSESDRDHILSVETQIQSAKQAEQSRSSEFIKLEEKHQALLKDLKATREQRVTRIESSKNSFLSIIRQLQDEENKELMGRHMEIMKNISVKEMDRLSSPHVYEDGISDLPILNAENIEKQEENK